MDGRTAIDFLCVTLYEHDTAPARAFYHDVLGLPIDHEQPGHITAMDKVCVHDPSEGPPGTVRLYFLADDPSAIAAEAEARGVTGVLRADGSGQPAWEAVDPTGISVVVLTRP